MAMKRNFAFVLNDSRFLVNIEELKFGEYKVKVNDEEFFVRLEESPIFEVPQAFYTTTPKQIIITRPSLTPTPSAATPTSAMPTTTLGVISASMPGTVMSVKVKPGDFVKQGDVLLTLETMKMENPIKAPRSGVVKEIKIQAGKFVNPGDPLILLE
ncbi:MAG: acetyl-CoA carboxylase biotin carboxyl carrier protein subunit [Candidatus Methanomethylicota archaeon]|uniref:Acetyl-CoA carboxylase biotin carboxyl carrier protein subunit n=1 Tax=Thermoproteota archaeon TaxID=2056631 RepID=A0A497EMW0_9CREN|nr:MAG: acetyl-CoA carboxylase biotin carboxyl carrier protein subunit [Candidatus Verstraetearchaeota archaeon]